MAENTVVTPPHSEKTRKTYDSAIKRLQKAGLSLTDTATVIEHINNLEISLHSKKQYYQALADYFKTSDAEIAQVYKKEYQPLAKQIKEEAKGQRLTEAERANYADYDTICSINEKLKYSPFVSMEEQLLVAFYTMMPPVRADYSELRIFYRDPWMHVNHVYIDGDIESESCVVTVRIAEHKTAHSSGVLERVMPPELRRLLAGYIAGHEVINGTVPDWLFAFPPAKITKILQRVFGLHIGKEVSVNIIRHAYVTKQTKGRPPLAQLEAEAREMGHSVLTHETYRRLDA
jgi:hypothetical protein